MRLPSLRRRSSAWHEATLVRQRVDFGDGSQLEAVARSKRLGKDMGSTYFGLEDAYRRDCEDTIASAPPQRKDTWAFDRLLINPDIPRDVQKNWLEQQVSEAEESWWFCDMSNTSPKERQEMRLVSKLQSERRARTSRDEQLEAALCELEDHWGEMQAPFAPPGAVPDENTPPPPPPRRCRGAEEGLSSHGSSLASRGSSRSPASRNEPLVCSRSVPFASARASFTKGGEQRRSTPPPRQRASPASVVCDTGSPSSATTPAPAPRMYTPQAQSAAEAEVELEAEADILAKEAAAAAAERWSELASVAPPATPAPLDDWLHQVQH